MNFLIQLIDFMKNVSNDERIPASDKKILLVLLALIASPIDVIPDWIPLLGQLDDLVMISIILDYFYNHLDQRILLSHYPWGMKSFIRLKKLTGWITFLSPKWFKRRIWSYRPELY